MPGIKNAYALAASVVIASNATLGSAGTLFNTLRSPIAASERQRVYTRVSFTLGATGGIRAQYVIPAGGTLFINNILLVNVVTPAVIPGFQAATAAFTNALAVAGTHYLIFDATITNGITAGFVDMQVAQNTVDALTLTVLAGSFMDATIV